MCNSLIFYFFLIDLTQSLDYFIPFRVIFYLCPTVWFCMIEVDSLNES